MLSVLLGLIVLPIGMGQSSPPDSTTPASTESIGYHFRNERFLVSSLDLEIGSGGSGTLVFVRKGLSKPVEREVHVSADVLQTIDSALDRLRFLSSTETYQTSADHSNLGHVTISVVRGDRRRDTEFNYTTNKDMAALQEVLRGLATREMYVFDIETAARFQPLDTPKLLSTLEDEIDAGRVTDPAALVPMLRGLADDVSLPLIARNKASAIIDRLSKAKRK